MQKITIGICDDEKSQRDILQRMCMKYFDEHDLMYESVLFKTGMDVLAYEGRRIHLLFLDVEMKEMDGIQLIKELERQEKVWRVVFVSGHPEAVWNTFGLKTLGFERKPVLYQNIEKWISITIQEHYDNVVLECNTVDGKKWIEFEKVYYIEAQRNYVNFYTCEGIFLISGNLKSWEEELTNSPVIRVHRRFLVNPAFIKSFGKELVLKNGEKIPIGRQYHEQAEKKYDGFIREKIRGRV